MPNVNKAAMLHSFLVHVMRPFSLAAALRACLIIGLKNTRT
jgi:hypothetical protein